MEPPATIQLARAYLYEDLAQYLYVAAMCPSGIEEKLGREESNVRRREFEPHATCGKGSRVCRSFVRNCPTCLAFHSNAKIALYDLSRSLYSLMLEKMLNAC